jgi:glycosyltransferase involved in cell wall biosynthesis
MRIAQVAPLWELVPPATYGGTELVVHLLTEELVRLGHEVTLFAATGSTTKAKLIESCPAALRALEEEFKEDKTHSNVISYEMGMIGDVMKRARQGDFDMVHNHVGFQMLSFADFIDTPVVTTLHNCLSPEKVKELYMLNRHLPYISISDYQQTLWPELNYAGTIYHGINLSKVEPCYETNGKDYFAFLGRLSPEKGPHHAIKIAKALGKKLIMAGKIDRVDKVFYDREIAHFVDGDQIQYIGEVNHEQKVELLRNAELTLCPIEWAEPFGLVMIESMACGTPVLALKDGSIPEVIDHNKTGYVGTTVDELIEIAKDTSRFDRREVRAITERRFSMERMAADHVRLYEQLIRGVEEQDSALQHSFKTTPNRGSKTSTTISSIVPTGTPRARGAMPSGLRSSHRKPESVSSVMPGHLGTLLLPTSGEFPNAPRTKPDDTKLVTATLLSS